MDDFAAALSMAQTLLQFEVQLPDIPRRELIAEKVDLVLSINPAWRASQNREALIAELETRFRVWIGESQALLDNRDHETWLVASATRDWKLWQRYLQYLALSEDWAPSSLSELDRSTDQILGLLENPARAGSWDRRGLVVGHVQFGKTANYTGLICKAADAGYRVIIVLAGMHDNLRSQTQTRLDEGFLGFETSPDGPGGLVGAGLIASTAIRPGWVTNRSDKGDFSRATANNFGIAPPQAPTIFVVKKNKSILTNILTWIARAATRVEDGRPVIDNVPLLVIDDEADQASVDTKEQPFDGAGNPDPDHDPTQINGLIRRILGSFEKSAFVGYTATPFANIYIHELGTTPEEGEDLFPRSFIINLPAPSTYVGPARVFGLDGYDLEAEALPLMRLVSDHANSLREDEDAGWMPPRHTTEHRPLFRGAFGLPDSLREAIRAFVLTVSARRARGQLRKHNSMLVHVTRYTKVQSLVQQQVQAEVDALAELFEFGDGEAVGRELQVFRELWERDFVPSTTEAARIVDDAALVPPAWSDVAGLIPDAIRDIRNGRVRAINGSAGDILDYKNQKEVGLNVIAVGGDKLARGLTLEGLSVSYFLRASRMYDTLMQMGRWFGYRPGYLDLCRLYTTRELVEWFQYIAVANEELRAEFDRMVLAGGTPRDYGLKVRSHSTMLVTSRVKMRHGTQVNLTFAGDVAETTVFHSDGDIRSRNVESTRTFLRRLGEPTERNPERQRPGGAMHRWDRTYLWSDVDGGEIQTFMRSLETHPAATKINRSLISDFIQAQRSQGELVSWTVALFGNGTTVPWPVLDGMEVDLIKRAVKPGSPAVSESGRYTIRRLLAPRDEAIDLDAEAYGVATQGTRDAWVRDGGRSRRTTPPTGPAGLFIRACRPKRRGLLLLYPLSPDPCGGGSPVIGLGLSFPASDTAINIKYMVNNVYWQQEYGGQG